MKKLRLLSALLLFACSIIDNNDSTLKMTNDTN